MRRGKLVLALIMLFFSLQLLDFATSYYGIVAKGLKEDNPRVASLVDAYGIQGWLIKMFTSNLSSAIILALLCSRDIGPLIAIGLLGAFSLQFVPTVLNNMSWIFLDKGLYFEQLRPINAFAYTFGCFISIFYLAWVGEIDIYKIPGMDKVEKSFRSLSDG